jgi:TolA-binding protein
MTRHHARLAFFAFCSLLLSPLHATPLDEARAALDNGFPQVALVKLESHFPNIATPRADPAANLLYAEALIAANQLDAAISLLKTIPPQSPHAASRNFWLAQAHAANGDWTEALALYSPCSTNPTSPYCHEALVGRARMLKNLARPDESTAILQSATTWPPSPTQRLALLDLASTLLDQNNPAAARTALTPITPESPAEKSRLALLLARASLLEDNPAAALALLSPITPTDPEMAVSTVILHASALSRTGHSPAAESLLEEFLAAHPSLPGLENVFASLDKTYAAATTPSSSELKRWADDPQPSLRSKLATYYLARYEARQKNPAAALPLLEKLAADPASNPLAQETLLELASLRLRLGLNDSALALLPPTGSSPATDFLRGLALSRKGENAPAARAFLSASTDPTMEESALFNAALCDLLAGSPSNPALARLQKKFPHSERLPAFHLQEAFLQARNGNPKTLASLEALASSAPAPIASRARLALAEWKFQQLDFQGATLALQSISTKTDPARELSLQVFLADTGDPSSAPTAIATARSFLTLYPESEPEPSVRMKLGELLFRNDDFAAARVELESLAHKFPDSDYSEPALFLAARAAARIPTASAPDDAMLLFEEVAALNRPLAPRARLEQAALLTAQRKPLEANTVLDKILSSSQDPNLQATALIEKGKNLYFLGDTDPAFYHAAIDIWKQITTNPSSQITWRNQALVLIGSALEKTGDIPAAIATYYDVFQPTSPASSQEFFWFYKAGFAAGRLLESCQKWPEAIRTYSLLSASNGPRSLEAKNRIKKIRLEHFLWDDTEKSP